MTRNAIAAVIAGVLGFALLAWQCALIVQERAPEQATALVR